MGKSPIRGTIYFSRTGRAKVHPEKGQPISLARGSSGTALHGDLVELFRLPPKKKERKRGNERPPRFEVRKIIRRETNEFLGYFSAEIGRPVITSENPRIPIPFKILGEVKGINEGDKVLAKLVRWDPPARIPTCKILRIIGPGDDARTDHKGILAKYGLSQNFPPNVEKEANSFGNQVSSEDLTSREDLRDVFTITIDPLDARDFDDAISLKNLENGDLQIGVHIADVSNYVRPGTALDQEARKRANSTYLVGEVVPMLPHSLSSGLCSLIEAEDRLVKSVSFRVSQNGDLLGHQILESVICSDKRLTYEQALLFLQKDSLEDILKASPPPSRYSGNPGKPLAKVDKELLETIHSTVRTLGAIASKIRRRRMAHGSLELASSEVKILVDERGHPEKIYQNKDDESHQLIEEFMLLANQTIARHARKKRLPVVYRTHPDPDPENLEELRHFLSLFGISCGDLSIRKEVQKMLHQINKSPISQALRIKFLRSLQQACYRATPDGHYGLAMKDYLHFTSPIRRYADLVTHRAIESTLGGKKTKEKQAGFLEGLAKKLSISERISVDAERESMKDKLLLYYQKDFQSKKPVRRKALITELNRKGLFVELTETLARGFIPMRTLPRELGYRLASNGASLVGRNPKNKLRIGQEVDVQIDRINTLEKQMDFRLA